MDGMAQLKQFDTEQTAKILFDHALRNRSLSYHESDSALFFAKFCIENFKISSAQLFQDLLVVHLLGGKRAGFFVEFGATNGLDLSNTLLLENNYGWRGILAEPAKRWRSELMANRQANIEFQCVWSESGKKISFSETSYGELSTITDFVGSDYHEEARRGAIVYEVETISLNDLLAKYNAPRIIDYMSIDTEGSEFEILSKFDFENYDVSILTIEHNFTKNRENIKMLMQEKGYKRIFEQLSSFDDWYVKCAVPAHGYTAQS